ncbi:related to inosine-uridine preferring nucleoside hydrolase [Fusarium fujikuroi]|nr:related to inosine-uridine preferring nucleoside hydrolase [Fusarium fujikuroi]
MASNFTDSAMKVIIDTDIGGDDMVGLLMAMAAAPSIMQVLAITTVFGNVNVEKSLRNVVAMFYILWNEMAWRESKDRRFSYGAFQSFKPVVSLGSGHALGQPVVVKTNGRPYGQDGLWNFHALYPEFTPDDSWKSLFDESVPPPDKQPEFYQYFNASRAPSHLDILRILRDEPANTITLIALGPLTNMALAAAEDPETFLRAKELLIMGGAISVPGNISPVSEANAYNDAAAAARTYTLTSANLASTFPTTDFSKVPLPAYPDRLSKQLNVTIFPMDLTNSHCITYNAFIDTVKPLADSGSPLSTLAYTFMKGIHDNCDKDCIFLEGTNEECITLHDPVPVWYALGRDFWNISAPKDLRLESLGQWTKGMHVEYQINMTAEANSPLNPGTRQGNRVRQALESPGRDEFQRMIMSLFTN